MQADCSGGRVCESGFCVVDPNAKLDAAIDAKDIDAAVCPTTCDSCDFPSGTCTITRAPAADVTCPAGWNCTITCTGAGACGNIACNNAASCTIDCTAQGSGRARGRARQVLHACDACGRSVHETCQGSGACGSTIVRELVQVRRHVQPAVRRLWHDDVSDDAEQELHDRHGSRRGVRLAGAPQCHSCP